jgi:plasmid maintenance system antidote protein VapI
MSHDLTKHLNRTPEHVRLYQQERAKYEATELVCDAMSRFGITRTELAKRLGKTKGYVSQLLDGERNMTIDTISDVFWAIGRSLHFWDSPLSASDPWLVFTGLTGVSVGKVELAWSAFSKWPQTAELVSEAIAT